MRQAFSMCKNYCMFAYIMSSPFECLNFPAPRFSTGRDMPLACVRNALIIKKIKRTEGTSLLNVFFYIEVTIAKNGKQNRSKNAFYIEAIIFYFDTPSLYRYLPQSFLFRCNCYFNAFTLFI